MSMINCMSLSKQCTQLKNEILNEIENVINKNAFIGGEYVKKFEEDFAAFVGTKYAIGVSSGTDALFLACKALGISGGDEVIVPSNTFIASAWAPMHCGAKVIFAECSRSTWLLDETVLEKYITKKTKAIIAVHLYGQPVNIEKIKAICDMYNLYLIEDCAQAHGAKWKDCKVGSVGDIGCFSFYPGKNLGAFGDAGAVVTSSETIFSKISQLKDHGAFKKYHHDLPGYNMRMDGIQAAILSVKLNYLHQWNQRRKEISRMYDFGINNPLIEKQIVPNECDGVHHLYVVLPKNRENFLKYMEENNICCGIHYPIPCHLQKAFSNLGYTRGDLPITEYVMGHCVSLPIYPELTNDEIEYVIKVVNKYV